MRNNHTNENLKQLMYCYLIQYSFYTAWTIRITTDMWPIQQAEWTIPQVQSCGFKTIHHLAPSCDIAKDGARHVPANYWRMSGTEF